MIAFHDRRLDEARRVLTKVETPPQRRKLPKKVKSLLYRDGGKAKKI